MAKKVAKKVTKKRVKKNVERGQAHIQSSFNNTIVTLTDAEGNALFFLVCYCSLRTFSCSCIGLCFLTTNRKSFSVTDTTIASNLLKSLDVHSNFSS